MQLTLLVFLLLLPTWVHAQGTMMFGDVDFGEVAVGVTKVIETHPVMANGEPGTIYTADVWLVGGTDSAFFVSDSTVRFTYSWEIHVDWVRIEFTPPSVGEFTASLRFMGDGGSTFGVLRGRGVAANVSPPARDRTTLSYSLDGQTLVLAVAEGETPPSTLCVYDALGRTQRVETSAQDSGLLVNIAGLLKGSYFLDVLLQKKQVRYPFIVM